MVENTPKTIGARTEEDVAAIRSRVILGISFAGPADSQLKADAPSGVMNGKPMGERYTIGEIMRIQKAAGVRMVWHARVTNG